MKLCRFELNSRPGEMRSGIMHDHRVYETDGEKAIGIHEIGEVRLYPPIGLPPAVRLFDEYRDASGSPLLTYRYVNPAGLRGPLAEIDAPSMTHELDFEVRVCCAVTDRGGHISRDEAPGFVLGYSILCCLVAADLREEEQALGLSSGPSQDMGIVLGPYLTTPEDLTEFNAGEPTTYRWHSSIKVNDEVIAEGATPPSYGFSDLLVFGSGINAFGAGEIAASLPLPKENLALGPLGRSLLPGDRVSVTVEGLGTLVWRVA